MYQVSCGPQDQHCVNMQELTCSCRRWQLTGIPCIHAISVILLLEDRPENYVDSCYSVSTQKAIYSHCINPVRGENQWSRQQTHLQILPPVLRRPPGRPHKRHGRRETDEAPKGAKVPRKGVKMSCTKCGGSGHNTRTCKGPVRAKARPCQRSFTSATRRVPIRSKLPVRRRSGTSVHQNPVATPNQPGRQHQGNPRPSQPSPQVYTVRWMPTPTTQESLVTQSTMQHQGNSPRPSQPTPPPF